VNVDHLPGDLTVPSLGPKMACTKCGIIDAALAMTTRSSFSGEQRRALDILAGSEAVAGCGRRRCYFKEGSHAATIDLVCDPYLCKRFGRRRRLKSPLRASTAAALVQP
jgi:hypothetical protein